VAKTCKIAETDIFLKEKNEEGIFYSYFTVKENFHKGSKARRLITKEFVLSMSTLLLKTLWNLESLRLSG